MHSADQTQPSKLRRAASGAVLLAFGLALLVISWDYPIGRLTQMGPGFIPRFIGIAICILALAIIVSDVSAKTTPQAGRPHWRGLAFVGSSITLFAVLIENTGLLPSIFAAVLVSMFADDRVRPLGALVYSLIITGGSWLLFIVALELPIPAFWR
jgi:hypothetical protein